MPGCSRSVAAVGEGGCCVVGDAISVTPRVRASVLQYLAVAVDLRAASTGVHGWMLF